MRSPVLWVRFSDDSVPLDTIDDATLFQFETLWRSALKDLGFLSLSDHRFFSHVNRTPYLNFSLLTSVLSRGSLRVARCRRSKPHKLGMWGEKNELVYEVEPVHSKFRTLASLARIHWKLEQNLDRTLSASIASSAKIDSFPATLPETLNAWRIRSLSLGICQQLLLMRLPSHTSDTLAVWLMTPEHAPSSARRTLRQLLLLQRKRQELSSAWQGFFNSFPEAPLANGPEWFWSEGLVLEKQVVTPPLADSVSGAASKSSRLWRGLAVSPGVVEGSFCLIQPLIQSAEEMPEKASILIFLRARPQAVEWYDRAAAVLFIEGGTLSHACCVARERNLPCITGLGQEFLQELQASCNRSEKRLRVEINLDQGFGKVMLL